MKALYAWLRHNRGMMISILLISILLLWVYACQSTVRSIVHPDLSVNRAELQVEVDNFIAQAELRFENLNRQDAFKAALFQAAIKFGEGQTVNPLALALVLGNILGIGAVIDNQRKDVCIKTMKNNQLNYNRVS